MCEEVARERPASTCAKSRCNENKSHVTIRPLREIALALSEAGLAYRQLRGKPAGARDIRAKFMPGLSVLREDVRRSLTKPPSNIILRLSFAWICENLRGRSKFDQLSKIKEGGVIRDATGLLHIVGHGHDGVLRFEFVD